MKTVEILIVLVLLASNGLDANWQYRSPQYRYPSPSYQPAYAPSPVTVTVTVSTPITSTTTVGTTITTTSAETTSLTTLNVTIPFTSTTFTNGGTTFFTQTKETTVTQTVTKINNDYDYRKPSYPDPRPMYYERPSYREYPDNPPRNYKNSENKNVWEKYSNYIDSKMKEKFDRKQYQY